MEDLSLVIVPNMIWPVFLSIVTAGSSHSSATSCLTLLWAAWWPSALSPTYQGSRTTWTSWSVPTDPQSDEQRVLTTHSLAILNLKSRLYLQILTICCPSRGHCWHFEYDSRIIETEEKNWKKSIWLHEIIFRLLLNTERLLLKTLWCYDSPTSVWRSLCVLMVSWVEQVLKKVFYFCFLLFTSSARLPIQGQPPLYGLQLPAALCARLLCLPHHPQGEIIWLFTVKSGCFKKQNESNMVW